MKRLTAHVLGVATLLTCLGSACSVPQATEDSLEACHNGDDDDARGGTDCADEKCAPFCEASEAACTDGADQDGDQLVDCLDPGCAAMLGCAAVDALCDPWTSEGCTRGRACFGDNPLQRAGGTYCAVPGTATPVMGSPCEAHEDCGARHACVAYRCVRRCLDHPDCPRESACVKAEGVGLCPLPCVPGDVDGCSPGTCGPVLGAGFAGIPQLFLCDGEAPQGRLPEGAACEDVPGVTAPESCALPGLCVPEAGLPFGTGRCRDTCAVDAQGNVSVGCARQDRRCVPAFPDDPREPLPGRPLLGLCLLPEAP